MVRSLSTWVGEIHGKRRQTGGRAGAIVQQSLKGTQAEMLVVSLLHLSLNKPVLKTFDRVKVSKRTLIPFTGTSTCKLKDLDNKFAAVMSKYGLRRNAKGRPVRCWQKLKPTARGRGAKSATLKAATQGSQLVTPTKGSAPKKAKCFSGEKVETSNKMLRGKLSRKLEVVFRSAADVKDDNTTYCAAMAAHRLKVCDWKPMGQPHIVDANGTIYKGKPKRLDTVAFPLTVSMTLTKTI
eukprot:TRINITY_DN33858_c0_g1_i1.p1 TRINITY_DN33858_c0_g1~~TRINITY_DN33858_c0_g1_i1.p1  ORF type:complete len:253 (-),score=47.20 TRINITY_DN33858_c0_g1_i1:120-833(-)